MYILLLADHFSYLSNLRGKCGTLLALLLPLLRHESVLRQHLVVWLYGAAGDGQRHVAGQSEVLETSATRSHGAVAAEAS